MFASGSFAGCCTYHPTLSSISLFHQKKWCQKILQLHLPGCLMFGFRVPRCVLNWPLFLKSRQDKPCRLVIKPLDSGSLHFCIRDWTGWPVTLRDFVPGGFLFIRFFLPHSFLDPRFGTSSLLARILQGDEQLRDFHWRDTTCACCSRNHVDEHGSMIPCDKEALSRCIQQWLGGGFKYFLFFVHPYLGRSSNFD